LIPCGGDHSDDKVCEEGETTENPDAAPHETLQKRTKSAMRSRFHIPGAEASKN
jgi:hypothetical protein